MTSCINNRTFSNVTEKKLLEKKRKLKQMIKRNCNMQHIT